MDNNRYDGELLRLHIRANSNSSADQGVKLKVRDSVNAYIEKNVHKDTFEEAYADIGERLNAISRIAVEVLKANGFSYGARAYLSNEYFPSRQYADTVVEEGYYDALIIELGEAKGDNWWCVIYPPLCYGEGDGRYKSFFAELFS
ncbi:MAG: stage II sporulation protein R [Clostridiales bacterium]|nr:stage II sporulation protein R [Clostridiales bacterium]